MEPFLEKCSKCNITSSQEEMRLHKKTHATEASFPCDVCDSKFLQVTKLLKHIDNAGHIGLNCGICHSKTKTEVEMLKHLESCHRTPGRPFNCQFCDTKFRSNRELGLHILKHSDNHPFICTICQKGFKWKQVLKMHMLTHSNDQAHKCPTCGFTTKHKSTLKTHLNRHMGRSFSCTECKFTTAREQNLREHMKNHNREGFTCPICQEKFSQKKNLTRHLVRHSTKLPKLSCNECNFTTLRKDKLTAHMHMKHPHTTDKHSSKQAFDGDPNQNKDSSEAKNEARAIEMEESAEESTAKCTGKVQNLPKDTLDNLANHKCTDHQKLKREENAQERECKADVVFQYLLQKADSTENKDCLRESNETSISNDMEMDVRKSQETRDLPNVSITDAEEDGELSSSMSDSGVVEKEEPVSTGVLGLLYGCGGPPPELNSFLTGIQVSTTLKQEEILTPPNGDFVNPPNVTVTQSSPITLPFSYARSPYLTLLSPSDIEAVLCVAADNNGQQ